MSSKKRSDHVESGKAEAESQSDRRPVDRRKFLAGAGGAVGIMGGLYSGTHVMRGGVGRGARWTSGQDRLIGSLDGIRRSGWAKT